MTALNASKLFIESDNVTLDSINKTNSNSTLPTRVCEASTPIANANGTNCTSCPPGQYAFLANATCYTPSYVSNLTALNETKLFIESDNVTLDQLNKTLSNSTLPSIVCNASTPIFNGKTCIACPAGQYVVLSNSTCYKAKNVTNVAAIVKAGRYSETQPNATIKAIN